MTLIEVIYENGVLRPIYPLDLAEGTLLQVTMIKIGVAAPLPHLDQKGQEQGRVDEAAYEAFLDQMDEIAALPLQSQIQPHTARDHDAILYPKQGKMP